MPLSSLLVPLEADTGSIVDQANAGNVGSVASVVHLGVFNGRGQVTVNGHFGHDGRGNECGGNCQCNDLFMDFILVKIRNCLEAGSLGFMLCDQIFIVSRHLDYPPDALTSECINWIAKGKFGCVLLQKVL